MPHSDQRPGPFDQAVSPCPALGSERGFTLIEIIAVLLLMGILAAVAIGRSGNSSTQAEVAGAVETVKNHLRYAQATAMNSDVTWGLHFTGSTYTLRRDATDVSNSLPGDLPQGMTFESSINPVMFDTRWGSPGNTTITITITKGSSRTITVTKNTGFIP